MSRARDDAHAREALHGRRRILIVGAGGAGKSTLARALGAATGLPVIHLDQMYWRPGWIEPPRAEFAAALEPVLAAERWILDGNYSGTLAARLRACDAAVWLDPPRVVCLAGAVARRLGHPRGGRAGAPAGCPEQLTWEFVRWIWTYRARSAPRLRALLDAARAEGKAVVHLRSRRAAARLVETARRGTI